MANITSEQLAAIRGRAPDPARVLGGLRAKVAGQAFESAGGAGSVVDRCGRVMEFVEIPSGAKWIGKGRHVPVASPFDRAGAVYGSGRGVFWDYKAVNPKVASLRVGDPKIFKPHEVDNLVRLGRTGAISGVLVSCGRYNDVRWMDARHLVMRVPIRFDDPRWLILGPAGGPVPFRKLVEAYADGRRP